MKRKGALYRMFDTDGELLYVGITTRIASGRLDDHRADYGWHREVATITVEHFDCWSDAVRAEAFAIHREHPRYNVSRPGRASRFASELDPEAAA